MTREDLKHFEELVLSGEAGNIQKPIQEALQNGIPPGEIMDAMNAAMDRASEMWDRLEIFLPDVVRIAEVMKEGIKILSPHIQAEQKVDQTLGKIVLGTVEGDIHDIGRHVVGTLLAVNGFEVTDLGHDIPAQEFVDKAEEIHADIIGLSALMTTSMPYQQDVIQLLCDMGLKDKYKVMIGGGPVTVDWAKEIGADGYGRTALDAVQLAKRLLKEETTPEGLITEGGLV